MKINGTILIFAFFMIGLNSCKSPVKADEDSSADKIKARTPVTITTITTGLMSDSISLNAASSFLKKSSLKSSATGYVRQMNVKIGDYVQEGQILFVIQTKESSVYRSKALDSLLDFNGKFQIKANSTGIVTQVDKVADDYITDGEQLCIIAQKSSLVFLLNVPYELNNYIHLRDECMIELPDHTKISGQIDSRLSAMDAVSQTQNYIVRPHSEMNLPENLIAKIRILKTIKKNTIVLPKEAVLTDETEENFWIMKLINDSTAIRVPITKGIETTSSVEIVAPAFTTDEKILLTGQYGLSDTASVQITKAGTHE